MVNLKNSRLYFACLIFYCISSIVYSQERVNLIPERFDAKSPRISFATLWTFEEPKWVSHSNRRNDGNDYNFNYIRFGEIKKDTTSYYILIRNFNDGDYEYPSINRGWYSFKAISFYIYTKQSYYQIKNIQQGESLALPCIGNEFWSANWGEQYNEHCYVKKIKDDIRCYENKEETYTLDWQLFYIKRTKSNGKDVIRFWFPDDCEQYLDVEFETTYWEISYQSFKAIFI